MAKKKKSNLIEGHFYTKEGVPPPDVRKYAEESCEKLICIGIDKDGNPYFASSFGDGKEMLWLIEKFKHKLMRGDFDGL